VASEHAPLTAVFLARLPAAETRRQLGADLESTLRRVVQDGQASWPEISGDPERLVGQVADRIGRTSEAASTLASAWMPDLLLAIACQERVPRALDEVATRIERIRLSALQHESESFRNDVRRELLVKVLLGTEGARPILSAYRGRGSLDSFLIAAALRVAADLRRSARRRAQFEEAASSGESEEFVDIELAFIRDRYRGHFDAAFKNALGSLEPRARNVLRLYFIKGLNIGQIGALYSVHRSTVARWIVQSRKELVDSTRRWLADRFHLRNSEVSSLVRLLGKSLDVSLAKFMSHHSS
jgi:RNA polymerase sigma-70 factor, ECF subfamily